MLIQVPLTNVPFGQAIPSDERCFQIQKDAQGKWNRKINIWLNSAEEHIQLHSHVHGCSIQIYDEKFTTEVQNDFIDFRPESCTNLMYRTNPAGADSTFQMECLRRMPSTVMVWVLKELVSRRGLCAALANSAIASPSIVPSADPLLAPIPTLVGWAGSEALQSSSQPVRVPPLWPYCAALSGGVVHTNLATDISSHIARYHLHI